MGSSLAWHGLSRVMDASCPLGQGRKQGVASSSLPFGRFLDAVQPVLVGAIACFQEAGARVL